MSLKIPFNKPYLTGKEAHYIYQAVYSGQLSGNGHFTKRCQFFFGERYNFSKCLLTTSCTDALEMAALLLEIQPEDEIIMPSYTFVSTANAFVLRGAKIVFADSKKDHPNVDPDSIEALITSKTKAIVPVHYAGVACDTQTVVAKRLQGQIKAAAMLGTEDPTSVPCVGADFFDISQDFFAATFAVFWGFHPYDFAAKCFAAIADLDCAAAGFVEPNTERRTGFGGCGGGGQQKR